MKLLTITQVAHLFSVSRVTVRKLIRKGDLPAVRVSEKFLIPEQAAHDYLASRQVKAGQ